MSAPLKTMMNTICKLGQRTLIRGTVQSTLKLCSVSDTGTVTSDSDRWCMRETSSAHKRNSMLKSCERNSFMSTQERCENNVHVLTHSLTHSLHGAVLLGDLRIPQPDETLSAHYGSWRFNTVFTTAHHLFLSWARSVQFMPSHPVS